MNDKSTEWALMWAKVEARIAKEIDPSPAEVQRRITEVAKFDRGFLHAMGISLLLVLCLLPIPSHARKRNKIIAIGAAVGGAIVAGALSSTGNQSQQPTRTVVAHHGMRH